jgi:hypothetical protein
MDADIADIRARLEATRTARLGGDYRALPPILTREQRLQVLANLFACEVCDLAGSEVA